MEAFASPIVGGLSGRSHPYRVRAGGHTENASGRNASARIDARTRVHEDLEPIGARIANLATRTRKSDPWSRQSADGAAKVQMEAANCR